MPRSKTKLRNYSEEMKVMLILLLQVLLVLEMLDFSLTSDLPFITCEKFRISEFWLKFYSGRLWDLLIFYERIRMCFPKKIIFRCHL